MNWRFKLSIRLALLRGIAPAAVILAGCAGDAGLASSVADSTYTSLQLQKKVASVTVTPSSVALVAGGTQQLGVVLRDRAGNNLGTRTMSWQSSNPSVALVSGSGLVTAAGAGNATIRASTGGVTGTATVSVSGLAPAAVASISISPVSPVVAVGGTVQLTATLYDSSGNVLTGRAVTWVTNAATIATVSASGVLLGCLPGTATVMAQTGGRSGSTPVTVNPQAPPPATGGGFDPAANGYSLIVRRAFSSKAASDADRGTGSFPSMTGGSEGWDGSEYRQGNLSVANDVLDDASPGGVMRFTFPAGLPANQGPGIAQTQGFHSAVHGNRADTKLYTRSVYILGPTYWTGPSNGNKIHFHRSNEQGTRSKFEPYLVLLRNGSGGFRIGVNFQGSQDNTLGFFWSSTAPGNNLRPATRYVIETQLVMNSAYGVADGIFRCWINGTLVLQRTNVRYLRDNLGGWVWNNLHVSPTFGGDRGAPNPATFYMDLGDSEVWGSR